MNKVLELASHGLRKYDKFVEIDIENYEWKQDWIMEIGMSIFSRNHDPITRHFIINDHKNRFNKKFVEDNKYNFDYGTSEIITLPHAADIVRKEIHSGCVVVGHGMTIDRKALTSMNIKYPYTIDTQKLYSVLSNNIAKISLINLLQHYEMDAQHLHNGGNDAHYTAIVCKRLMTDLCLI